MSLRWFDPLAEFGLEEVLPDPRHPGAYTNKNPPLISTIHPQRRILFTTTMSHSSSSITSERLRFVYGCAMGCKTESVQVFEATASGQRGSFIKSISLLPYPLAPKVTD